MKIFRYEVELINDNDNDYYKTGLVISESKEMAEKQVYQHYDEKTTDYVCPRILLTEISTTQNLIIEDGL